MLTSNRENKYMLPVVNNGSCDIIVKKGEVLGVFEISNKHDDLMSISNAYFDLNQTNGKNVFDLSRMVDNLVSCSREKKITKRKHKRSKKKSSICAKPDCSNKTEIFDASKRNNSWTSNSGTCNFSTSNSGTCNFSANNSGTCNFSTQDVRSD